MELKVIENQLLPIYQNDQNEHLVNARELHEFIGSKQEFTNWIKSRIVNYQFIENQDFTIILSKSDGGRPRTDYILKIDTAKEIAMVENNDKGRQVRRYFIELENRYKTDTSKLSPQLQMLNQMVKIMNNQELEIKQVKSEIKVIQSNLLQEHKDDWRSYINHVLKSIGFRLNDYQTVRNDSYKELEKRANCNLKVRLDNMRVRALNNGKSKSKVMNLSRLDILEDETRLREIYLGIIREYAIKYEIEVS